MDRVRSSDSNQRPELDHSTTLHGPDRTDARRADPEGRGPPNTAAGEPNEEEAVALVAGGSLSDQCGWEHPPLVPARGVVSGPSARP